MTLGPRRSVVGPTLGWSTRHDDTRKLGVPVILVLTETFTFTRGETPLHSLTRAVLADTPRYGRPRQDRARDPRRTPTLS